MIEKFLKIAREAGKIIKDGFGKHISVEYKTNSSNLVTEIDKKSEETIISFIRKEFPGHNILAEESGKRTGNTEYLWVIDPLDGTTNFAHGLPIFSVSIGVQKNGETILGVIYDVMNDVMFSAELGAGSYKDKNKIHVSSSDKLSESLLVTGFPYDIKENPNNAVQKFNDFLFASRAIRRLGSAAIDFCYVAEGVFDGFWEVHLHPWDICAGKLLVQEAGGKVTNFMGVEAKIYTEQILASNGYVHGKMMEILAKRS